MITPRSVAIKFLELEAQTAKNFESGVSGAALTTHVQVDEVIVVILQHEIQRTAN